MEKQQFGQLLFANGCPKISAHQRKSAAKGFCLSISGLSGNQW